MSNWRNNSSALALVSFVSNIRRFRNGLSAFSLSDRKSTRLNSSHLGNLVCRLLLEKKHQTGDDCSCMCRRSMSGPCGDGGRLVCELRLGRRCSRGSRRDPAGFRLFFLFFFKLPGPPGSPLFSPTRHSSV